MKRLFILLSLSNLVNSGLNAQLVLTKANYEPVAGDIQAPPAYDSVNALPRNTGMNQTWNLSAIVPKNTSYITRTYMAVSSVPASSLFSGATLAAQIGPNQYEFYKSVGSPTTQLEFMGNSFPGRVDSMKNTRIDDIWPIAYGNSSTDTYSGNITGPANVQITGTITTEAKGSGTLILPGGYPLDNVLQVVSTDHWQWLDAASNPTLMIFTTITYSYYNAINKFPIALVVDHKSNLTAVVHDYSEVFYKVPVLYLGILESHSEFAFDMYPNPAAKNIKINLSNTRNENCMMQVYDAAGKVVSVKDLGNASGIKENISISNLQAGIYFVKIQLGNNASFKKLVVE